MNRQIILICFFLFTSYRLTKAEDELKIEVIEKPSADKCQRTTKDGDTLSIHYTGRLAKSGKVFDSSRDRKEPFEFTLGKGMVIQGYEQGLKDMCVGEHRKLTIPSHLGYGKNGAGQLVPGRATLEFDIELIEINDRITRKKIVDRSNAFKGIDKDNNTVITKEEMTTFLHMVPRMKEKGIPTASELVSALFDLQDTNKDGVLSYIEFNAPEPDNVDVDNKNRDEL